MREIKFRAWDKNEKRMIHNSYPAGIYCCDGTITPMLYFDGHFALMSDEDGGKSGIWEHDNARPDGYIIMQYTGLHDKNGVEIYEGDIVQTNEAKWVAQVIYRRDCFMCIGLDGRGFSTECDWGRFEAIGNIYENPELLGSK